MNVEMKVYTRQTYCLVPMFKPLSFLGLNVCGILSKMKHPDFLSLISNHDIIAISESKLDDTDAVDVPGYVAFYRIEVNLDGSLVEYYY